MFGVQNPLLDLILMEMGTIWHVMYLQWNPKERWHITNDPIVYKIIGYKNNFAIVSTITCWTFGNEIENENMAVEPIFPVGLGHILSGIMAHLSSSVVNVKWVLYLTLQYRNYYLFKTVAVELRFP